METETEAIVEKNEEQAASQDAVKYTKEDKEAFFSSFASQKSLVDKLILSNRELQINGRTLKGWSDFYRTEIPVNATLPEINALLSELNQKISNLNYNLARSSISRDMIVAEYNQAYSRLYVSLKNAKQKTGVKATNDHIEALCLIELKEEMNQKIFAEFVVTFFDNYKQQLVSQRKILETLLFALAQEAKLRFHYSSNTTESLDRFPVVED